MSARDPLANLRSLYSTRVADLRAQLPDLAERTHGQLLELYNNATPDRCDLMVRALSEVATSCRRLSSELSREVRG